MDDRDFTPTPIAYPEDDSTYHASEMGHKVGSFISRNKTKILGGAVVILLIKNRSLRKENAALLLTKKELATALETQSIEVIGLMDRMFGSRLR